jgi:murein DD-endopeptidase MepM/ murein hydrolase activator NlpD
MRAVITFFAGFIAGMLFLVVLLWTRGSLQPVRAEAPAAAPAAAPAPAPPQAEARQPSNAPVDRAREAAPQPATSDDVPSLIIPVQGAERSKILDTYTEGRSGHIHEAVDIMAARGTPVLAAADGTIEKLFQSKAGGTTIYQFDPTRTWCYYYAHLDHNAEGVSEGVKVRQGQVIGYVGSTGDASPDAPHLHFAIFKLGPEKQWWKGTSINPYPVLMRQARQ